MGKLRKSILVLVSIIMALVGAISVHAATTVEDISPIPNESTNVTVHSSLSASGIVILVLILLLIILISILAWFIRVFFKHKETPSATGSPVVVFAF